MDILTLNHRQVLDCLPDRPVDAHKGDFGRILLLCGSVGYTGAAAMAAIGALRCGAGLVYLGVPESIYAIEAIKLTEPIVFPLPEEAGKLNAAAIPDILAKLPQMDAVVIGCGLGVSEGTLAVTQAVLSQAECPVILDADGINVLSAHKDILRERRFCTILTPHPGEFARLGYNPKDRLTSALQAARDLSYILLLKGHESIITDGNICYVNRTGNPGMAVGGSGDVLAGMIAALVGQKLSPLTAAACGAWLHGKAGDLCAEAMGQYGMLPTDLLQILPRLLK